MHSGNGGVVRGGWSELPAMAMEESIRKGPWGADEDAILMEYVKRHGPRDWSSIRSKGLLPRTGKSCRLRWVNKLKPDLKTGCKFSAEEERVVIDLQARFGNKWARIATHLSGRTDNDVKNFWSTRQKRLARLLRAPLPVRSHRKLGTAAMSAQVPTFEFAVDSGDPPDFDPYCLDLIEFSDDWPNSPCFLPPFVEDTDGIKTEQMPTLDELCSQSRSPPPQPPFDHSLLDLPPLSDDHDLLPELDELSLPDPFGFAGISCQATPTLFDVQVQSHGAKIDHSGSPESYFSDFSSDLFECLDHPAVA